MIFTSKKSLLLLLGITAIVSSRLFFVYINDPEGPNLLVVAVAAAIVYFLSLTVYVFGPATSNFKQFLLAVFVQIVVVAGLCLFLK